MLNEKQRAAPTDGKQAYAPPVLTTYGDLATLTKLSNGSGTGKIGRRSDGSGLKT